MEDSSYKRYMELWRFSHDFEIYVPTPILHIVPPKFDDREDSIHYPKYLQLLGKKYKMRRRRNWWIVWPISVFAGLLTAGIILWIAWILRAPHFGYFAAVLLYGVTGVCYYKLTDKYPL